MRTSRISHDTSRALSSAAPGPTRTTRSALARFARSDADAAAASPPRDIEDAIPPAPRPRPKRKRPSAPPSSSPAPKPDIDSDSALSSVPSSSSSAASPPPKRRARQPAKRTRPAGDGLFPPPADWETVYSLVKTMRTSGAARDAAVDTMGCHSLALATASPRDQRFQTLVALMLSSQTKDTTNFVAMRALQTRLPAHSASASPGLTLENVLAVPPETLNELIWSVGFHNNKTKYIKAAALILRDEHGGDIPDTAEGLMALPGVGPKMAYLCLSAAWGRVEGIGVDVHVHRITNLWGWQGAAGTKGPEETRRALQGWLPRERWAEINWLLVGLGQTVCAPERGRRRCGECEVGLAGLCAAADGKKVAVGRRARAEGLRIEYEMEGEVKVVKEGDTKGGEMEVVKEENTKVELKVVKEEKTEEEERSALEDVLTAAGSGRKVKREIRDIPLSEALKLEEEAELGKSPK